MASVTIDLRRSAERICTDVETLAGSDFTLSSQAIRRYAYTDVYRATLDYFTSAWRELGFTVGEDPVGNLVARNRPVGEPVFGIGSHCDSNRNGGKWDGTLGVVCALEVCRASADLGLDLPLQAISFLEEEGSGFGQMVFGSRIVAGWVDEQEMRERIRAIDDGRSFWEHATDAGYHPGRFRECAHIRDDLTGWIELHIEQARVLQDTGRRVGVVRAIAGYVHGDITVQGRADHAGATPMDMRRDSAVVAGYPLNAQELQAVPARIGGIQNAQGPNIYQTSTVTRQIYEIRALVQSGNSGGPLLSPQGTVDGVVFAAAVGVADTGFALTAAEVSADARAGEHATTPVSTMYCD